MTVNALFSKADSNTGSFGVTGAGDLPLLTETDTVVNFERPVVS